MRKPNRIWEKKPHEKPNSRMRTLRDQTVYWTGVQFCVRMFLDFRDNYSNMFQNVSGFQL